MKRMVENSEKIEELADAIKINDYEINIKKDNIVIDGSTSIEQDLTVSGPVEMNDKLDVYGKFTTSNINLPNGFEIKLFDENMYNLDATDDIYSMNIYNLGTALIGEGKIRVDKANGDYNLINVRIPQNVDNIFSTRLSCGDECDIITDESNNIFYVKLRFNKELATTPRSDYYSFIFLVGYTGQALWEDY